MNNVLDELFGMLPPGWRVAYLCTVCKHFKPKTFTCPAFPKGIPSDIMEGFMFHTTVFRNQVGEYVFEPKPDFKLQELFRTSDDLTRRLFRPREDIIKWITYKGRRIPIFKKTPPSESYKALSHHLVIPSRSKSVIKASVRAVKRLSEFLEEKNAKWVTKNDPFWQKYIKALEHWYPLADVKRFKTPGELCLPQITRIDRTFRKLEKHFPGILSDVRIVCIPCTLKPYEAAFSIVDKAYIDAEPLYSFKFDEYYCDKIFKYVGISKKHATYSQLRAVYSIPENHIEDMEQIYRYIKYREVIEKPIVCFVSTGRKEIRYPNTLTVAHEFGHVLQAKYDKLKEFMLDVYAPYLGRCIKAGFDDIPREGMTSFKKLLRLNELYQKNVRFRNKVFTPYSLANPGEGYAEAFKGYILFPKILKQKWPEAYDFFRKIEERGLS